QQVVPTGTDAVPVRRGAQSRAPGVVGTDGSSDSRRCQHCQREVAVSAEFLEYWLRGLEPALSCRQEGERAAPSTSGDRKGIQVLQLRREHRRARQAGVPPRSGDRACAFAGSNTTCSLPMTTARSVTATSTRRNSPSRLSPTPPAPL